MQTLAPMQLLEQLRSTQSPTQHTHCMRSLSHQSDAHASSQQQQSQCASLQQQTLPQCKRQLVQSLASVPHIALHCLIWSDESICFNPARFDSLLKCRSSESSLQHQLAEETSTYLLHQSDTTNQTMQHQHQHASTHIAAIASRASPHHSLVNKRNANVVTDNAVASSILPLT